MGDSRVSELFRRIGYLGYVGLDKHETVRGIFSDSKITKEMFELAEGRDDVTQEDMAILSRLITDRSGILSEIRKIKPIKRKVLQDISHLGDIGGGIKEIADGVDLFRSVTPVGISKVPPYFVAVSKTTGEVVSDDYMDLGLVAEHKGIDLSKDELTPVILSFDPSKGRLFQKDSMDRSVTCLNTYYPPKWMSSTPGDGSFYIKVMDHLFVDDTDKRYVYGWIKQMVTGRNNIMLILRGARGCGKSVMSSICSALVGARYARVLPKSVISTNFNSAIENCRLGVFEEVSPGAEGGKYLDQIKAMMNDTVSVEAKGVNAKTLRNFCSFIMCLNQDTRLGIQSHERRFALPKLASVRLDHVIGAEELSKRMKLLSDPKPPQWVNEELAAFFEHVVNNAAEDFNPYEAYKGDNYWEETERSLMGWRGYLKAYVEKYYIEFNDLHIPIELFIKYCAACNKKKRSRARLPEFEEIAGFLSDYMHYDVSIGSAESIRDSEGNVAEVIKINKEYLKAIGIIKDTPSQEYSDL